MVMACIVVTYNSPVEAMSVVKKFSKRKIPFISGSIKPAQEFIEIENKENNDFILSEDNWSNLENSAIISDLSLYPELSPDSQFYEKSLINFSFQKNSNSEESLIELKKDPKIYSILEQKNSLEIQKFNDSTKFEVETFYNNLPELPSAGVDLLTFPEPTNETIQNTTKINVIPIAVEMLKKFIDMAYIANFPYCLEDNELFDFSEHIKVYIAVINSDVERVLQISFQSSPDDEILLIDEEYDILVPYPDIPDALVHKKYYKRFMQRERSISNLIKGFQKKNQNYQLHFTGHGSGGVYAIFTALLIKRERKKSVISVFTFGQPRVGNKYFANYVNQIFKNVYRVTIRDDPITLLPPQEKGFIHYWTEIFIDPVAKEVVECKAIENENPKNDDGIAELIPINDFYTSNLEQIYSELWIPDNLENISDEISANTSTRLNEPQNILVSNVKDALEAAFENPIENISRNDGVEKKDDKSILDIQDTFQAVGDPNNSSIGTTEKDNIYFDISAETKGNKQVKIDSYVRKKLTAIAKLANLSYCVKMYEFSEYIQVNIIKTGNTFKNRRVFISFRGKLPPKVQRYSDEDTKSDFAKLIIREDYEMINYPNVPRAQVHRTFYMNFKIHAKVLFIILQRHYPSMEYHFTGHGSGGSYAIYMALYMKRYSTYYDREIFIYTFGQPRSGDRNFAKHVNYQITQVWRVTSKNDPISLLPPLSEGFRHHKKEVFFDQQSKNYIRCDAAVFESPNCANSVIYKRDDYTYHSKSWASHMGPYFGTTMGQCPGLYPSFDF
ncbi:hypothetical protein G9A89_005376 [Geosiphon pyriformis]|nr:hypothetical protein G9A89_005376 [Geosiphon pyriformis]